METSFRVLTTSSCEPSKSSLRSWMNRYSSSLICVEVLLNRSQAKRCVGRKMTETKMTLSSLVTTAPFISTSDRRVKNRSRLSRTSSSMRESECNSEKKLE